MKSQKGINSDFINVIKQFICLLSLLAIVNVFGNANINAPVCTEEGDQIDARIVNSSNGKSIIAWKDSRPGADGSDIYAQCVDINSNIYWPSEGVVICNASANQMSPQIISDKNGGAIIGWLDMRHGYDSKNICVQRIDSLGSVLWAENGVAVCDSAKAGSYFDLISDGEGGAILTWEDSRIAGTHTNLFAQRVNYNGERLWSDSGLVVCDTSVNMQPKLVTDGTDGAIITWGDGRSPLIETNHDIYAQKVNGEGVIQWTHNGVAVTRADYGQRSPQITTDNAGGAIIAWYDFRDQDGLYTQRVNSSGNMLWLENGLPIDSTSGDVVEIVSDSAGGAYYIWPDRSFATDYYEDIFVQYVNNSGTKMWGTYGISICDELGYQRNPQAISHGTDGFTVTWNDTRDDDSTSSDIYAQRVSNTGSGVWPINGVCISNQKDSQYNPAITGDSLGSYITWYDYRNYATNERDIYMQGVDPEGNLYDVPTAISDYSNGNNSVEFELYQNYPNPFNPVTTISYTVGAHHNVPLYVDLSIYNILGQKVSTLISKKQPAGDHHVKWDASGYSSGIYFYKLQVGDKIITKKMMLIQ